VIVDVMNDLEFPGGEDLLPWAERLVPRLKRLRAKAHALQMPVIYVNDNYGLWQGEKEEIIRHCTRPNARGRKVSEALRPTRKDYVIFKARHSGFYATMLLPLLEYLGTERLLLSGIATNLCVLFTAHDAHMHRYELTILSDCCAAESDFDHDVSLQQLRDFCGSDIRTSQEVLSSLRR
jgi:nicotinamidase-related amidase